MTKKYILSTLLVLLIFLSGCIIIYHKKKIKTQNEISASVKEICKTEKKSDCLGECMDGFGATCYFDSTIYNKEDLNKGDDFGFFSQETKKTCFALHSTHCGDCFNKFELKKDISSEEVSCEDFFQSIENKNKECNNCLENIFTSS